MPVAYEEQDGKPGRRRPQYLHLHASERGFGRDVAEKQYCVYLSFDELPYLTLLTASGMPHESHAHTSYITAPIRTQ